MSFECNNDDKLIKYENIINQFNDKKKSLQQSETDNSKTYAIDIKNHKDTQDLIPIEDVLSLKNKISDSDFQKELIKIEKQLMLLRNNITSVPKVDVAVIERIQSNIKKLFGFNFLSEICNCTDKKKYRTRKHADEVCEVPPYIPAITNRVYQNAITLNQNNKAYLQPLSNVDNLVFEDGRLLFKGMPTTMATLKQYFTQDGIEKFDLPLLRMFYGVILNRFQKTWKEDKSVEEVVKIYYPELVKKIGKKSHISDENMKSCINSIMSFQTIVGVFDKGRRGQDILPVLVYMGNDVKKNTISFASPYMVRVIKEVYNASIRKNKKQFPLLKRNGNFQTKPSYSYLIKSTIAKEKNKKAVEIVFNIVSLIEQCGNNKPHIKVSTIIERNPLLKQAIKNSKTTNNINTQLNRTFSKLWELLLTQTNLIKYYKNIKLPDPKSKDFKVLWIPTSSTLDMVFSFPHEGKKI